jgi:hypothetical protein
MAEVQTTYATDLAVGYPGMVANGGNGDRISRTVENSGGIGFGKVAYRGSGDHGCVATQTLVGAGSEAAGNVGTGTITDAPTVAAGAKIGRHIFVVIRTNAAGEVIGYDPDGIVTGDGVIGTEFTMGGITATISNAGTMTAGDRFFVDVTGNEALGITIAHQALGLLSGETADKYQRYDNVAILCGGEPIWVTAGGTVTDGSPVFVAADGDFEASGTPLPGWKFDTSGGEGDLVKIVKR